MRGLRAFGAESSLLDAWLRIARAAPGADYEARAVSR
jgi:hypothetical protein